MVLNSLEMATKKFNKITFSLLEEWEQEQEQKQEQEEKNKKNKKNGEQIYIPLVELSIAGTIELLWKYFFSYKIEHHYFIGLKDTFCNILPLFIA